MSKEAQDFPTSKFRLSEHGFTKEHFEETQELYERLFGASLPMYGKGGLAGFEFTSNLWVFGSIFKRGRLDIKRRALCTLAGLTVLGRLNVGRIWINACLNIGCSVAEVCELIIWTSYFGGHPAMRDMAMAMDDVLAKRGKNPNLKMA